MTPMPERPISRASLLLGSTLSMWLVWAADLVWPGTIGHGIVPRTAYGLTGILMAPFLHLDLQHLFANTIPFAILGAVILLRGVREFLFVLLVSAVVAGLGTWLFGAPNTQHIGASGVVFGFLGYLLIRAVYDHRISSALIALAVGVVYGGMFLTSLMPAEGISWTGHVFGFLGGVTSARLRYRRDRRSLEGDRRSA
jgi:membrane associated rhomboid family serine protease